jgi:hypothetical protein
MSWVEAEVEHEESHLDDTVRCIDDDFLDERCLHAESEQISCWRPGAVEVLLLEARETESYSPHSPVYRRTISSEINKLQRERILTCHNPGSRTAAEQLDERYSQPTRSHISPAQHKIPPNLNHDKAYAQKPHTTPYRRGPKASPRARGNKTAQQTTRFPRQTSHRRRHTPA